MPKKDPSPYEVMKEFKDEVVKLTREYKTGLASLDKAVTEIESHKIKFWVLYKKWIVIVTVFVMILFAYVAYKKGNECRISFTSSQLSFELAEKGCKD